MAVYSVIREPSIVDALVREPIGLVKTQPQQVLISLISVSIMARFAADGSIVDPAVGYLAAVGIEWGFLRGLAYNERHTSLWGRRLVWVTCSVIFLWGVLYVAKSLGAYGHNDSALVAWLLAFAHIAPIVAIALCSAMAHSEHVTAIRLHNELQESEEQERMRAMRTHADALRMQREQEEQRIALERKRKEMELEMFAAAATERAVAQSSVAKPQSFACAACGHALESRGKALAARRYGHCAYCKNGN